MTGDPEGNEGRFEYVPLSQSGMTPDEVAEAVRSPRSRARAALRSRQADGSPRVIRLMSDYSAVPLWHGGMIAIEWLELSPELEHDILAWDELFQTRFHWEDGWRDLDARDEYARLGPILRDRLAAEVKDFAVVELDLWPVDRVK